MNQETRNNRHFSEQYGHANRSAYHDAQRRANKIGLTLSRSELKVTTPITWLKRQSQKKITGSGK